ncbi:MAG: hypothetical protein R3F25_04685 [Gammaproteobacteria bacterium]
MYKKTPRVFTLNLFIFYLFSSMSQAETRKIQSFLAQCDFNHNGVIDGRTMVKKEKQQRTTKLESGCSMDIIRKENAEGEKKK